MRRGSSGSRGVTVAETLVALVLTLLVTVACGRVVAAAVRGAADVARRGDEVLAERWLWRLLRAELGPGRPAEDWRVERPGVVSLRAFRAVAFPCGPPGSDGTVDVRVRGIRLAEPDKDSVLVLDDDGSWRPIRLLSAGGAPDGACDGATGTMLLPGGRAARWILEVGVSRPRLLRLFERGSYHVEDGSLRYRRGGGGRQPITPPLLDPSSPGLLPADGGVLVRFRLATRAGPRGRGWIRPLGTVAPR